MGTGGPPKKQTRGVVPKTTGGLVPKRRSGPEHTWAGSPEIIGQLVQHRLGHAVQSMSEGVYLQ